MYEIKKLVWLEKAKVIPVMSIVPSLWFYLRGPEKQDLFSKFCVKASAHGQSKEIGLY